MTKYEKLIDKAERLGATIMEVSLTGRYGFCYNDVIFINANMSNKDKTYVLSEEIGHYIKTYGDITDQTKIENIKQENVARRYGYSFIVEPNDIIEAMRHGANNIYEIADYLDISCNDLLMIIADYKKQYGLGVRVGNYYLRLEPSFGIVKDFGLFKN